MSELLLLAVNSLLDDGLIECNTSQTRHIDHGELFFVRKMVTVSATEGPDDLGFERLTPRHLSILQLIGCGLTNGEIGNQLHLSQYTISQHVSEMFRRTGAVNRADLVARAHQAGLFNGTRSRSSGAIKDQVPTKNSGN